MEKMVNKFTLTSGKIIYLREPVIADQEQVGKIAGAGGEKNPMLMAFAYRREMLKQLLVGVNSEKILGPINLDKMFSFREYNEAVQAVSMVTGEGAELGNLTSEVVTFGEQ